MFLVFDDGLANKTAVNNKPKLELRTLFTHPTRAQESAPATPVSTTPSQPVEHRKIFGLQVKK